MRIIHRTGDGRESTLATTVEVADSFLSRARGLMFRRGVPDDYALVFPFDKTGRQSLHMAFVPFPIDAVFLVDDEVTKSVRLRPWTGLAWGRADTILELPAGTADAVEPGDEVRVVEDEEAATHRDERRARI